MSTWRSPVEAFSPKDKGSFAYTTVARRWPTILTSIASTVHNEVHNLSVQSNPLDSEVQTKISEGQAIISALSELKHDMGRNYVLAPIEDDGEDNVKCYNDHLKAIEGKDDTWFTAEWLFAECYLYRRLRTLFSKTQHWNRFDPFFASKAETYKSSSTAIIHLAKALQSLESQKDSITKDFEEPGSALEVAYLEMMQAALWGNATDLSLLVDLKYEDLQKLQSVGQQAQAEQMKYILRNDFSKTWEHVKKLDGARLDIVLDNAGFELYTDLILADFLISYTPFFSEVVFHPKTIPWFVSDVLPYDFNWAIDSLGDREFFSKHSESITSEDLDVLQHLSKRWRKFVDEGRFKLSVPLDLPLGNGAVSGNFWTQQYPYQLLPEKDPALLKDLSKSGLVIFKGDLNYRKLVGDGKWGPATPFEEALGPLAGKINLLSLRTNKADPIVGLPEGLAARLDQEAPDFRTSGKYAVVSFCKQTSGNPRIEQQLVARPGGMVEEPVPKELSVLTFNVWGLKFVSKDRTARLDAIADWLASHSFDVVCLQECWIHDDYLKIKERVKGALPHSRFFHSGALGSGLCIFTHLPIVSSRVLPYSLSGLPLHVIAGDFFVNKAAGCIVIDGSSYGIGEVEIWSTHMHAAGEHGHETLQAHRTAQAWQLGQAIRSAAERGRYVIAAGDFNSSPWSLPVAILRNHAGLDDSYLDANPAPSNAHLPINPEDAITNYGMTVDSPVNTYSMGKPLTGVAKEWFGKRLDYIFYRGPSTRRWDKLYAFTEKMLDQQTEFGSSNAPITPKVSGLPKLECIYSQVILTGLVPGSSFSYSDHFPLLSTFRVTRDAKSTSPTSSTSSSTPYSTKTRTIEKARALLADYLPLSLQVSKIHLRYLLFSIGLALGLTVSSAWQPKKYIQPIWTLAGVAAGALGATMLYVGWVWGRWEEGLLNSVIREMEDEMEQLQVEEDQDDERSGDMYH